MKYNWCSSYDYINNVYDVEAAARLGLIIGFEHLRVGVKWSLMNSQ